MAFPPQTKYIVGNEACERFSFYGMRSILVLFMTTELMMSDAAATEIAHLFLALIYIMPLLGGWLADKFLGRYNTIFWISLFYCLGHGVLATADLAESIEARQVILFSGLFIIALGAGGIKPCVSAFVGDQMEGQPAKALTRIYAAFYWSINLGSFFSFIVIPFVRQNWGYGWAFGIPGIFMALATFIFWLGRKQYLNRRPEQPEYLPALITRLKHGKQAAVARFGEASITRMQERSASILRFIILGLPVLLLGWGVKEGAGALAGLLGLSETAQTLWGMGAVILYTVALALLALYRAVQAKQEGFFGVAGSLLYKGKAYTAAHYDEERCKAARNMMRVLVVFAMIIPFWSLFDQTASSWVLQGKSMQPVDFSFLGFNLSVNGEVMQSANPLFVMLLIPLLTIFVYPYITAWTNPLRRMGVGIVLAAVSYGAVAWLQYRLEAGEQMSILWQLLPYLIITVSEVLVSTTGLEYAYAAAGKKLKSTVISFWNLTSTLGNFLVIALTAIVAEVVSTQTFMIYGVMTLVVGLLFIVITTRRSFAAEHLAEDDESDIETPKAASQEAASNN